MSRMPSVRFYVWDCAWILLSFAVAAAGCATAVAPELVEQARLQTDMTNTRQDLQTIGGRIEETEVAQKQLREDVRRLAENAARDREVVGKRLSEIEGRIKAVDAAREADKQETIERLSAKIAEVINRRAASTSPGADRETTARRTGGVSSAPGAGVEHVVKENETLSAIARRYDVSVDAIVGANRLKDRNAITAGQKLTIPR